MTNNSSLAKIDKMMVSDIIKTLIQKKLVSRSNHKLDNRAYVLSLTKVGESLILKTIPIVEGKDAEFFTAKTKGLLDLNRILNRVLSNDK